MSRIDPCWKPLVQEIKLLAAGVRARQAGAFVRLVRLGLKHGRKLPLDRFVELLNASEMPPPRVSEIKAILADRAVARQFITSNLGIRQALKQARAGKRRTSAVAHTASAAAARTAIVEAAAKLVAAMRAAGTCEVDCRLYRFGLFPLLSVPSPKPEPITPS